MDAPDAALTLVPAYRMVFPAGDPGSFEAYCAMLRPVFEATIPDHARDIAFESVVDTFVLDAMFLTACRTTSLRFERGYATVVGGGVDEIMVVLYAAGTHTLHVDGRVETITAGDVVVYDLSRTAAIDMSYFETISLTISRRRLEEKLSAINDIHGVILRSGVLHAMLRHQLQVLPSLVVDMRHSESDNVSAVLVALVASCLQPVAGRRTDANVGAVTLSMVRNVIEQNLSEPDFGPAWLMRHFGLSRATLYRMFESLGGVASYIKARRLRHALRVVTDFSVAVPRISQLAFDLGYASPTAFGRVFREHFGITPSQAREMAWRPRRGYDSPWQIPKITEAYLSPMSAAEREDVHRFHRRN